LTNTAKPIEGHVLVALGPAEVEALVQRAVEAALKTHANPEQAELLTTDELAAVLKMSPDMVRYWCRMHDCPHVRAGKKKLRFRLADVLRWLEEKNAV